MNTKTIKQIFKDTDFVHRSGTPEEKQVAEYLKARCEALGAEARLEAFRVPMAEIESARLLADGREIPCRALFCCGSGETEAELYYMPGKDRVSVAGAKDKIVLLDTLGVDRFLYQDLLKAGAKGILFQYGNAHWPQRDIDERDLRELVVGDGERLLCAMLNCADAAALVKSGAKRVRLSVRQREFDGESQNVVAELPGETDEWIVLTAHYDTVPLSRGSYDNMSGCVGLLEIMEAMAPAAPHRYGLRFVFCGSEERGLLGSKAYVQAHEGELEKIALNVNLDMIGSIMGRFIACVTAEDALVSYIRYFAAQRGWGIDVRAGVYSSDSTPFADKGVPAVSFARLAPPSQSNIHSRYDTLALLSDEQLRLDGEFAAAFTAFMADAVKCPVKREIPEKLRGELDEYLNRKRKD